MYVSFYAYSLPLGKMVAAALIVAGVAVPVAQVVASASNGPRDADNNAIMYNGAYSKTEWLNKVDNGATDKDGKIVNTSANLKQIYFNEGRGITEANFMSNDTVDGSVTNTGDVIVNGVVVATNVWSSGRQFIPGSEQDHSVYMRPTSVSFLSSNLDAFVNMQGGTFHYAVLKACGNPVKSINKPFGQIFKRVVDVTQDPSKDYAADDNANALGVKSGDTLKYLVRINNQGTAPMTNVVYTDDLPAGIALASDPTKRHIEHNLGTIPAGGSLQAEINAVVVSTTDGAYITNKACYAADLGQQGCDNAVVKVTVPKTTPTPTPTHTPTPTPTPSHTPTPTPTPSQTPTPTPTPSHTPTPTPTPSHTPTPTPTPSNTPTPTPTPTHTPTPTPTPCVSPSPSTSPSPSATPTPSNCVTPTPTPTPCETPVGGTGTDSNGVVCGTSVTPTPTPTLPDTGATGALAGAAGIGGIGYASRAYLRSRKSLIDSLRRK